MVELKAFRDNIGLVVLSRPHRKNALDRPDLDLLYSYILEASRTFDAVILTGSGDSFCSGADLHSLAIMDRTELEKWINDGIKIIEVMEEASIPFIAAVNGVALGGGLELALACDYVYAVKDAKMGFPEIKLGWIPGWGGITRLLARTGLGKAREILTMGDYISASEAFEIGLIDGMAEDSDLLEVSYEVAQRVIRHKHAFASIKSIINEFTKHHSYRYTKISIDLMMSDLARLSLGRYK